MARTYKAEIKEVNGKKVLVVHVDSEEVVNPDGSKSVIIHAPSLSLVNKTMKDMKEVK